MQYARFYYFNSSSLIIIYRYTELYQNYYIYYTHTSIEFLFGCSTYLLNLFSFKRKIILLYFQKPILDSSKHLNHCIQKTNNVTYKYTQRVNGVSKFSLTHPKIPIVTGMCVCINCLTYITNINTYIHRYNRKKNYRIELLPKSYFFPIKIRSSCRHMAYNNR